MIAYYVAVCMSHVFLNYSVIVLVSSFITVTNRPDKNNVEDEIFILALDFQGSAHDPLTPYSGLGGRQSIMEEGYRREQKLRTWQAERRERERKPQSHPNPL